MTATTTRHDETPQSGRWPALPLGVASREEAAKVLGIHVRSVDRMAQRGELAVVRYSGRTMVPITELERLVTPTTRGEQPLTYHEASKADTPEV